MLWVKGSGGDVGTMKLDGFATLYMDKLRRAEGPLPRRRASRTRWWATCPTAPSTSTRAPPRSTRRCTPMCPTAHVDHMHPDAIIAIARPRTAQRADAGDLRRRDRLAAVAAAGLRARPLAGEILRGEPGGQGRRARKPWPVHLGRHGQGLLRRPPRASSTAPSTGSRRETRASRPSAARCASARRRGAARDRRAADAGDPRHDLGRRSARSGISTISRRCSNSSTSRELEPLAALGTSCPDHFLRTKIRPLVRRLRSRPRRTSTPRSPASPPRSTPTAPTMPAYYERCKHADSPPMRDPNPVVYLVPGVGMLTFARDKATARIAGEFYVNAINVMRGASAVSTYRRPARAGGLRHRILAARGSQAPAHAEAEGRWPAGSR